VFEFKPVSPDEIFPVIKRGFKLSGITDTDDEVMRVIAQGCGGDVRKALNAVEICVLIAASGKITAEIAKEATQKSAIRYDRAGDEHYDVLSGFQKSIRAGDENTALYYLARLLAAGDLPSACRRLLVIAAEDIGLAFPNAIAITKACTDAALQLGLPEARIPLAEAVILLATSPKSTSANEAISRAMADVEQGKAPGVYYTFGDNKMEQAALEYRKKIKGE
jgi:putative ATPase